MLQNIWLHEAGQPASNYKKPVYRLHEGGCNLTYDCFTEAWTDTNLTVTEGKIEQISYTKMKNVSIYNLVIVLLTGIIPAQGAWQLKPLLK